MSVRCVCGTEIGGDDVFSALRTHVDAEHAEFGLTDVQLDNFIAASARLPEPGPRLDDIGPVEIHDAGPDRLDDLLAFFDRDGFAGNPIWASCYCVFFQNGGSTNQDWVQRTERQNRAELAARIRARTTTGLLAYAGGRPAAWVNASARSEFPAYAGHDGDPDDRIGSIVCFVVAPPYRRHGLASRLLSAACDAFAERGFPTVEAYPLASTRGDDASAYHGPLEMYLSAGFERVGEVGGALVVRRSAPSGA